MTRVTGIGGIFFKSKDPQKTRDWYNEHLGIQSESWGYSFEWRELDKPEIKGSTIWSPFPDNTKYFQPSEKQFMINYRVDNLSELLEELRKEGVQVMEKTEESEFGKFGWILDPDGNKIELWEPPASS
ncbi:MAG: VOC family protein [Ignavibacteriales bacterium]|nr:VOC family protein [Ignavibacteriales bacterium]